MPKLKAQVSPPSEAIPLWWLAANENFSDDVIGAVASVLGAEPNTLTTQDLSDQREKLRQAAKTNPILRHYFAAEKEQAHARKMADSIRCYVHQHVARELEELKAQFDKGDQSALMRAVVFCAEQGVHMPSWPARPLMEILWRAKKGEIDCWDQVFGRPKVLQRRFQVQRDWNVRLVWNEIRRRKSRGEPLDFAAIGQATGVGGFTTVARLYAIARQWLERPN